MIRKVILALGVIALWGAPAFAQLVPSSEKVLFNVIQAQESYLAGDSFRILFRLKFDDGWHGQSHNPSMEGLIATSLKLSAEDGISLGRVVYPEGKLVSFEFSETPLSTYEKTTFLGATVALPLEMKPGVYTLKAALTIQTCNDNSCLMSSNMVIGVPLKVSDASVYVVKQNEDIFAAQKSLFEQGAVSNSDSTSGGIGDYLASNGLLLTFVFIFIGGLALNLTPCVYPLIPITVSYFGGQSGEKKGSVILHAFLYLLGMAVMYSVLGLFAALSGSMFGDLLRHPAAILMVAGVMVALSLSMFGLYEIQMPSSLTNIGGKNREGVFGTFVMGLTVGIIAAPCIGPFVVGLLAFVGERGDPLLGFSMFFVLALGLGLPFVVLAIFSGGISKIPSSGVWMLWVRQVFGFVLLGMALYFMEALIPEKIYPYIFGVFLLGSGVFLGWISKMSAPSSGFKTVRWTIGFIFVAVGLMFLTPSDDSVGQRIAWTDASASAIAASKEAGRPVIIDFSADWCLPCKELKHFTFSDVRVVEYSKKIDMLFADLTSKGKPGMDELKKKFNVLGVPTIIFLDDNGNELTDLRFVGFVPADEFLEKMKTLTK